MLKKSLTKKTKVSNLHKNNNVKKSFKSLFEKKISHKNKNSNQTLNVFSSFDAFFNKNDEKEIKIEDNNN